MKNYLTSVGDQGLRYACISIFHILSFAFISNSSFAQAIPCNPFGNSVPFCTDLIHWQNNGSQPTDDYSIDGSGNNIQHLSWGMAGNIFDRLTPAHYIDGYSMIDRGNPRMISNKICNQVESIPNQQNLSAFTYSFLQFIDHDIDLTQEGEHEFHPIQVPAGDQYFDPESLGNQIIPFTRVHYDENSGAGTNNPRQQINLISSWIDGSGIYGSDNTRANWLRSGIYGKLKSHISSHGELLPCNTATGNCNEVPSQNAPFMAGQTDRCGDLVKVFVAGDVRANEQVTLTALHTLFLREHNRICTQLVNQGSTDDDYNYYYARRIVIALLQSILYYEQLPALGIELAPYCGYDASIKPDILNSFATAAYRLGHTMVTSHIVFKNKDCSPAPVILGNNAQNIGLFDGNSSCSPTTSQIISHHPVALRNAFFNPSIIANNGIESLFRGIASQTQEEIDVKIIDDLRNFLFGNPGDGGLDLAAINIQRGRDHGIADYNSLRKQLGLNKVTRFKHITKKASLKKALREVYGQVNNIDPWIGLLAEDHLPNKSVGISLHQALQLQFSKLRDGDRFYFENHVLLDEAQVQEIRNTTLADIIHRNCDIEGLKDVFKTSPCFENNYCQNEEASTEYEWIEEVQFGAMKLTSGNDHGYGDYTNQTIELLAGSYEKIKLRPGYAHQKYRERWKVWIDFDQDGIFSDEELILSKRKKGLVKKRVYIPTSAKMGLTMMRVAMAWGESVEACDAFSYGEVEDYMVYLSPSPLFGLLSRGEEIDKASSELKIKDFSLFPNPTVNQISIQVDVKKEKNALFQITNSYGQVIISKKLKLRIGENIFQHNMAEYPAGSYFVSISNGIVYKSKKFVLIKN